MDRDQYLLGDDQASVGSVESVPGGFIPPVQGAGLHAEQPMYMSTEKEVRRTVHAWRGAAMPAQTAVIVQDVQATIKRSSACTTGYCSLYNSRHCQSNTGNRGDLQAC